MKRITSKSRKSQTVPFETLEGRQLMSVSPLVINGTAGNDVITVNYGANLVIAQSPVNTTPPVAVAKKPIAVAKPVVAASVATTKALVFLPPTVLDRLTYTVDGHSTTTTLQPGQTVVVNGLDGNDLITVTGKVNTQLNGGNGNDTLIGGTGADQFNGGAGMDTVDYSARTTGVSVTFDGIANDGAPGEGDNVGSDIEIVNGGSGNDYLANNINDPIGRQFNGNAGNDTILGGAGNDTIRGGSGNDFLVGNAGNDVIYSGSGASYEFGCDGNDSLFAGTGQVEMYGGNGDDIMVSIGGNAGDDQYGGAGNNSFWVGAGQTVKDATTAEAKTNVHRVLSYDALHVSGVNVGTPTLALGISNLPDPNATYNGKTFGTANFSDVPLFGNSGPVPADINQGGDDDCYFMAPLSAIAKTNPNAIEQSVVSLGDGTYAVDFKKNGVDHFIRVDADLPVNSSGGLQNAHFGNGTKDLWAPIMEKAWAFFRTGAGTYQSTGFGFPSETFNAMGISNSSYNPHSVGFLGLSSQSATEFSNGIASELAQGNEVALCTPQYSTYLEGSHCYMVDHVTYVNGQVASITIRNPWGTDGPGGNGANDGYITMTGLDVLKSVDLVTYAK